METEFLKLLHEEDFFSGLFSTPNEHEISMEMPHDSLINIIENDYDVDTSQPITFNSIWNDNERNTDTDVSFATKVAVSQEDENFSKLLTEWQNCVKTAKLEEFRDIINVNLSDIKHILQYEGETENFSQEVINLEPELKLEKDGQRAVNFEEEDTLKMIHDTMKIDIETKTKKETKKEKVNDLIILPELFQETHELKKKGANTTNKNRNLKGKRKKETNIIIKDKQEEQEDRIHIETISDKKPALEAGDITSLLEQFEASENPNSRNKSNIKNNILSGTKLNTMQQMTQKYQSQVLENPPSQVYNQHKSTPDSVSKEVIDRIKASGRKRAISIIPAMPNIQNKNRSSNNTRMQDVRATFSHNKVLKQVTNDAKNKTNDTSVQLDHDYCYNVGSATKSCDSNKFTKHTSVLKSNQNKKMVKCNDKIVECHNNSNLKKDSDLESADVCDTSKLTVFTVLDKKTDKINENRLENDHKDCEKKICLKQSHVLNDSLAIELSKNVIVPSKSSDTDSSAYLIRSTLAKSILRMRNDLSKNTLQTRSKMQMVSVLKKPPNASQSLLLKSNSDENIVTTTNSLNNKVQNIIVQDTQDLTSGEQAKKPPFRKKLNLAEYRNRRDQNRSDNSRTNSPIQPTMLLYIHHASTTTEPITNDPENPIWFEKEIVSILKPKSDIDEEKNKSKPLMCDIGIQTYETVFEFSTRSLVDTAETNDKREQNMKDLKQRSYRKDRICRSSSRSRSKSKSKKISKSGSRSRSRSRSRNRNRSRSNSRNRSSSRSRSKSSSRNRSRSRSKRKNDSSRSRSRSRSRRCSRRRRIRSRRRSSVSSTSSCSSHSRSYTTSTRSRFSRSRSRSFRSRSRSEYSSCSRSSSYSNYGRSRWSNHRRKSSSDRERSYDRYKRHSFGSRRSYKDWRSPVRSYYKSYNWYNREKQREVEERRVIYVGRLDEKVTKADLRKRFENFGSVVDISVHLREHGDNYGFVTFAYKNDAYAAIEHGNDDPSLPTYDLSFGGRRAFCKYKYSDLDDTASSRSPISKSSQVNEENTFDFLLEEAKAKLRKRKV